MLPVGEDLTQRQATSFRQSYKSMPGPYSDPDSIRIEDRTAGGAPVPKALYIQPPTEGRIYASWPLTLPSGAKALTFQYGLTDPLPVFGGATILYSGASFHVFVNGEELFQEFKQLPGVNAGRIDVSKWAGQPVVVQVAVDAEGTAIFDWGFFSQLMLEGEQPVLSASQI